MKPWLVVLGNSLDFPRPSDLFSPTEPTGVWPHLLLNSGSVEGYWMMGRGGAMSSDVLATVRSNRHYFPENCTVAINVGIVDACPRPYPRNLEPFMVVFEKVFAILGWKWRANRSRTLLRLWGRPWRSISAYRRNLTEICALLKPHNIVLIGTQEPGHSLTKIVGHFSMGPYNRVLEELANQHDWVRYIHVDVALHPDGQHLTHEDHIKIAQTIGGVISGDPI